MFLRGKRKRKRNSKCCTLPYILEVEKEKHTYVKKNKVKLKEYSSLQSFTNNVHELSSILLRTKNAAMKSKCPCAF